LHAFRVGQHASAAAGLAPAAREPDVRLPGASLQRRATMRIRGFRFELPISIIEKIILEPFYWTS
jgi:hypothetical protein